MKILWLFLATVFLTAPLYAVDVGEKILTLKERACLNERDGKLLFALDVPLWYDWRAYALGVLILVLVLCISRVWIIMLRKQVAAQICALRENEQRFDFALSAASVATWDFNFLTGNVIYNDIWYEMLGYSKDEFKANLSSWKTISHQEDLPYVMEVWDAHIKGKTADYEVEQRLLHKDGRWLWVLTKGRVVERDENGEPSRVCGTLLDVTSKKNSENNLRASEERLRTIFENAPVFIDSFDELGRCVLWNKHCVEAFGWTIEELNAHDDILALFYPDFEVRKKVLATFGSGIDGVFREWKAKTKDGKTLSTLWANFKLPDGDTISLGYDITNRKQLEEELRHAEKMKAVGQLAGGVAHDFNNMLTGIMGATDLLKSRLPEDEKTKMLYDLIVKSSQRAVGLTEKLLSFSRKQEIEVSIVDVHSIINDTVLMLESTIDKRIKIEILKNAENNKALADVSQLQNIFLNISINAAHAMLSGGVLTIKTSDIEIDSNYCKKSTFDIDPGNFFKIEFTDTGVGISPENVSRIFEPFFTTKEKGEGSGLGLSAVFGNVQQHKGEITVQSKEGEGTTFTLLLPSTIETIEQPQRPPISNSAKRGQGKILIVDDEPVMRITARVSLEELGYEVLLANDGAQGLEVFKEELNSIDLVILDMIMPVMNGRDCFYAMKKLCPDIKVVLSSGFAKEEDVVQMKKDGLSGVLRKPYRNIALKNIIYKILGKQDA